MRFLIAILTPVALLALVACPAAQVPKGPPPEYEDPPAPSWIDAGKGEAGSALAPSLAPSADAGGLVDSGP